MDVGLKDQPPSRATATAKELKWHYIYNISAVCTHAQDTITTCCSGGRGLLSFVRMEQDCTGVQLCDGV